MALNNAGGITPIISMNPYYIVTASTMALLMKGVNDYLKKNPTHSAIGTPIKDVSNISYFYQAVGLLVINNSNNQAVLNLLQ